LTTEISLDLIKELRERSGAGIMDCKRALESTSGDLDKAAALLVEQGIARAERKADRVTAQGLIESYIHAGRIGAIVEVNCETDFVARTAEFQSLVHEIAMQVVGSSPKVVSEEELTEDMEGTPAENVLLLQPYIRDPSKTIRQLISETIGRTGENIQVRRFSRFELGQ
jgi:elongation factor Ts